MLEIEVVEHPGVALAILDPLRSRVLSALSSPGSAASVAQAIGMTRQKVNYHLRTLETHGLVQVVEQRTWGGLTERVFLATASSYVISPVALGRLAGHPESTGDHLSARYLIALAARAVGEVGSLLRRAKVDEQRLATLAIEADICFGSAAERAEFATELAGSVKELAARYHRPDAPGSRSHRLCVLAFPGPPAISIKEEQ